MFRIPVSKMFSKVNEEMTRINLDFSERTLIEVLEELSLKAIPTWFLPAFNFLKEYQNSKVLFFTSSGTTGSPKKFNFDKKQIAYSAELTLSFFDLKHGDKVLLPLSCNYVAGKMMLCRAIVGKLNLSCIEPTNNPLQQLNDDDHFKFCPLVPLQLNSIFDSELAKKIKKLGTILLGGAEFRTAIKDKLLAYQVEAWSSFGMTETLTHFALKQISPNTESSYSCIGDYTVDKDNDSCLVVKNSKMFTEGLFCNDVIECIDITHFNWIGRRDNVVNSGGIKLFPEQIEAKIKGVLPPELSFVLIGIPDVILGTKLVFVSENNRILMANEIQVIKSILSTYEFPKEFKRVDAFVRTESGKIIRRALPSLLI